MNTVWQTAETDEALAEHLAQACEMPRQAARVLVARGCREPAAIQEFLQPRLMGLQDPETIPGIAGAAELIGETAARGGRIAVYGDYDVDGLTATALMIRVLRALGAPAEPFLPSRMEDGYGLNPRTFERCLDRIQPELAVSVDCGTNSVSTMAVARARGVRLVVTDHHQCSGAIIPADVVVNPRLGPNTAPWHELAGVGVAFKLAHALIKRARREHLPGGEFDLRHCLDLVALGTVADCVPLVGENRVLVRHGLRALAATPWPGLQALMQTARLAGSEISCYHAGFVLGPRLNAAGRLGTAESALELLLTSDPERADALARELEKTNQKRQKIGHDIFEAARLMIESDRDLSAAAGLVVASREWNPGIVGIVAARLASLHNRPVAVIALDGAGNGRGSCRGPEGFNLVECLTDSSGLLRRFGGHAQAAGLEVAEADLPAFRDQFAKAVESRAGALPLQRVQRVDAWMTLREVDDDLGRWFQHLQPCGHGNPEPVLAVSNVALAGPPRRMGADGQHVRFVLDDGSERREAVGFNWGERAFPETRVDVAFELRPNTWNGRTTHQLHLRDLRPAGGDA